MIPETSPEAHEATSPSKKGFKIALFSFVGVIVISSLLFTGIYLGQKRNTNKSSITEYSTPSPDVTPTPDITTDWKTYTNADLSFKYPSTYTIIEPLSGTLVIANHKDKFSHLGQYIAVDTRLTGTYTNYDQAVQGLRDQFTDNKKYTIDQKNSSVTVTIGPYSLADVGIEINKMLYEKHIYWKHKNGAVTAHYANVDLEQAKIYDQILSTFKFSNESQPTLQPSPTVSVSKTYKDSEIGYEITYPESYKFTKTYGKDIAKLAPTDVINGIQLDKPYYVATLVLNVINKKDATSLLDWWNKYSPNRTEEKLYQTNYTFKSISAIKKTSSATQDGRNKVIDHIYFLWKDKIWLVSLEYYEEDNTSTELTQVANSLQLPN